VVQGAACQMEEITDLLHPEQIEHIVSLRTHVRLLAERLLAENVVRWFVASVTCASCGSAFEITQQMVLHHERTGVPNRCSDCRVGRGRASSSRRARPPSPQREPSSREVARMHAWWLSRFTVEELRSWPPLP
jgi:hypothetical protein